MLYSAAIIPKFLIRLQPISIVLSFELELLTQHLWTTNASLMLSNKVSLGNGKQIDWVSSLNPFMNK